MSHEGPDRDQVRLERIGNMDRRRLESTDECHVQSVAVVAGRKINDSVTGSVQLGQLDIVVAFGARLICGDVTLLVAEEDGDDDACQTE